MLNNFYIIKKYANVIKDYPLFFIFAKHNKIWNYIYPYYKEDVLQIIALACLISGTQKEKNNFLQRELYYFYNHVIINYKINKINKINKKQKKYKKYKPNYLNHCDICNKDKREYMYKSFYPGKIVCKGCYKNHKRKYIDPTYCRNKKC